MTQIMVTNDDGYDAPGILALAEAMQTIGDVQVTAPSRNQSTSGHKKTLFQDITYERTTIGDGIPTLSVVGSPADCITILALGLAVEMPDLVVSGINRGANMGQDLTYSGTVTAALEAAIHGIPAIAVSLDNRDSDDVEDYRIAAQMAVKLARYVLKHGLPPFSILNLNIPNVSSIEELNGLRLTRQGIRVYLDHLTQVNDYTVRIEGDPPAGNTDELGTDLWAVHNNYVSVTPVHLDMTAHQFMANLEAWDIEIK